ncbi:Mitochondrial 2-oxoglutarate/malate carrier protein [Geodia barretti]|uniref:Mitochondrial 2-oxoglutarate/malate carrier protein n=1 Tax=Geodia barretti TaxID=519541 RepID=A0AA35WBH1_GEOBA|nr:Mitochondrial 2-oxoglutarate/malate carrier protein [Geodia barretti]
MAANDSSAGRKLTVASPKSNVPAGAIPRRANFVLGGLAGCTAVFVTQPLDLIKNRMQLSGEGGAVREHKTSFHAISRVIRSEGVLGLYNGLSAGLLRQATYSTTRLGIYQSLYDKFTGPDGKPPNLLMKLGMGVTAGGIGSFIGTPAEISLIRMTSDGRLPVAERRGYTSAFNALFRISREEGVLTLWRGCGPTMVKGYGSERCTTRNLLPSQTIPSGSRFLL